MYLFTVMVNIYHNGVIAFNRGKASDEVYTDCLSGAFQNVVWLKYGARVSSGFGPLAVVTSRNVFLYEGSHTRPPI